MANRVSIRAHFLKEPIRLEPTDNSLARFFARKSDKRERRFAGIGPTVSIAD